MASLTSKIKTGIRQAINNLGFHCDNPIIVFESDDWGSIRVPSIDVLRDYQTLYPDHALDFYQMFDTLENSQDLSSLASLLRSMTNRDGKHPVFTMNYAMANPLFTDENCQLGSPFVFEPIWETFFREQGVESGLSFLRSHEYDGVFRPQLHGREHLNVTKWRRGIEGNGSLKSAYRMKMIGFNTGRFNGLDALNAANSEIDFRDYLSDAYSLFIECFGYESKSFVPPCYVINHSEEKLLSDLGVCILQSGIKVNRTLPDGKVLSIPTPMGAKASHNQVRLIRNVQFEPSRGLLEGRSAHDVIVTALSDIKRAIDSRQPAIVCTHRANYVGGISRQNRESSLGCLEKLLEMVLDTYPTVTFLSSDELGRLILQGLTVRTGVGVGPI